MPQSQDVEASESDTVVSVRGEADLEVEPDAASLGVAVRARATERADATRTVSVALTALQERLAALGGVARRAQRSREALTWSAGSLTTHPDYHHDHGKNEPTVIGHFAEVALQVAVRDFALLDQIVAALVADPVVNVNHVHWSVDEDNPRWRDVRAAAIEAAQVKGRDYATALGCRLVRLEQLADVGLLADSGARSEGARASRRTAALGFSPSMEFMDSDSVPSLDPVPQLLSAAVDARFVAHVQFAG